MMCAITLVSTKEAAATLLKIFQLKTKEERAPAINKSRRRVEELRKMSTHASSKPCPQGPILTPRNHLLPFPQNMLKHEVINSPDKRKTRALTVRGIRNRNG